VTRSALEETDPIPEGPRRLLISTIGAREAPIAHRSGPIEGLDRAADAA
jgi:hypothetical protein